MEYLALILAAGITALGGVLVHIVAHDLCHYAPSLAKWMLDRAVWRLPEADQARFHEEWYAHLEECRGTFPKLRHAIECLLASRALAKVCLVRPDEEPTLVLISVGDKHPVTLDLSTAGELLCVIDEAKRVKAQEKDGTIDPVAAKKAVTTAMDRARGYRTVDKLTELLTTMECSKVGPADIELRIWLVDRFGRNKTKK